MSARVPQAVDFLDECTALRDLLDGLPDAGFARATQFKGWSIDAILRHLHVWNQAAAYACSDPAAFAAFRAAAVSAVTRVGMRAFEDERLGSVLHGSRLLCAWWAECERVASLYRDADPRARVPWVNLEMSVASAITARQMETWAHGQAIFDVLGRERQDADRLRNVAHLGVATIAWSFTNRGLPAPAAPVHVRLLSPAGAVWEWNADATKDSIAGAATEFCQVVTQTRNVADTRLEIRGDVARRWMAIAQCFAGPPVDPPPPGTRQRATH